MPKKTTARPRVSQFLADTLEGRYTGVFIDDTGLPGLDTGTEFVTSGRKTWVAVVVPPRIMPIISSSLTSALENLRVRTGAEEFHFADIYSGRKQFKGIELNYRLACFDYFSSLFAKHDLPIFVQSFEPSHLARMHAACEIPKKIGWMDMQKTEDAAFFFLMKHIQDHLVAKARKYGVPARVFVDEGRARQGVCMRWPFEEIFADGLICFMNSSLCFPLQLADFAAFALTRNQWIMTKPIKTEIDMLFVALLSRLGGKFRNVTSFPVTDLMRITPREYARITGQLSGLRNCRTVAHMQWRLRALRAVLTNTLKLEWRTQKYFWRSVTALMTGRQYADSPLELSDEFADLVRRVSPPANELPLELQTRPTRTPNETGQSPEP